MIKDFQISHLCSNGRRFQRRIDKPHQGSDNTSSRYQKYPFAYVEIVDKTATYVARNGYGFEERIRDKEQLNPKFGFLNPNDPYHDYYQSAIQDAKDGKLKLESGKVDNTDAA